MKVFNFLFSGWFMGLLLLAFATAVGYATFIENDFDAEAAKLIVYNAWWFELLLFLMVVNFTGMIFTKKLYVKNKWNVLFIHIALIIIVFGAGITRYFGFEGQMHIRNGYASNMYRSATTYLQAKYEIDGKVITQSEPVFLTNARKQLAEMQIVMDGKPVKISLNEYSPNTQRFLIESATGEPYVAIVIGGLNGRYQFYLKEGEEMILYDIGFSFGDSTNEDLVQIIRINEQLMMRLPKSDVPDGKWHFEPFELNKVFQTADVSFVAAQYFESGRIVFQHVDEEEPTGIPMATASVNNQHLFLPIGEVTTVDVNGKKLDLYLGTRDMVLPFYIKLDEFKLDRYPGSKSPSSFTSDVTVLDSTNKEFFKYSIFMNHILQYRGYRFFQSSYDEDEQGTILSINHDFWGTTISYTGYFLLFVTLIISFFTKKNRFARVTSQLKEVHAKRKQLTASLVILMSTIVGIQSSIGQNNVDFAAHAKDLAKLFVLSNSGRIEPLNTLANNVVVKIHKKNSYQGMSADEVMLSMLSDRERWKTEPIIIVPEESIQEALGITGGYASYSDFVAENGSYLLMEAVETANRKKPSERTNYDKGIINVDERLNVFMMVMNRSMLKIFPQPGAENSAWTSPSAHQSIGGESKKADDLFTAYLSALKTAAETGDFTQATAQLNEIKAYQIEMGGAAIPSQTKQSLEIFYNKTNIFKSLFPLYMLLGIVLVTLFFLQTFRPSLEFPALRKILTGILILAFLVQTFGLGVRWYISGHAPWSNGYESMIYISWATMLAGFIFMKRSAVTLGVTTLLAGITLLTAHMSWLNPELTNLVPVLKSNWLTIHVATITASYGFLGLGCMVAFLNLWLMIFRTKSNAERLNLALKELMLIIEMALMAGIVLLVIGNFLGGIWANESWGRYWGWDPKESWTLVTIILYSFTLHLTLIPAIRNTFTFSFMSFISFGAVLMTYFGVNYYLTGLHSYAAGDKPPIPTWFYYVVAALAIISIAAAANEVKFQKHDRLKPTS